MSDERRVAERRTLALRGPGAGGFTPAQSVAASNPCLNCGTNIQLEFCPECGQREIDADPTLKEFLHELAEEFLHWDGKLIATLRLLFTQPGALTQQYLEGKRVRFISPLRLYLTCSVLYFFFAAMLPSRPPTFSGTARGTQVGIINIGTSDTVAALRELDSLARQGNVVSRAWGRHFGRAMRDRRSLSASITDAIPRATFVLLPVFAALFALFFRDRRRRYPQHLAFAMHVHAVLFIALTALLLGRLTSMANLRIGLQAIVGAAMGAYLLVAAHRVYGGTRPGVLTRLVGLFASYLVAFGVVMLATFGIIVLAT
ncbi:MAG: DUF3667 domain-containing protein [Gemmatimonadaceae bacterium]